MKKAFLEVGKIVSTHGVQGEVRVQPWCDSTDFLCQFDTLYMDRLGNSAADVIRARPHGNVVVMKLKGIDSMDEAATLRGKLLYISREDVRLDEGAYFVQDLLGMQVLDADTGEIYGVVDDVSETGANDVYHICFPDGTVHYIPAIPDVVTEVDVDAQVMRIRPLKGLFDDAD